jgi:tRNA threonylcarbamoyladenosine modification (KEOPS) complex Cgi121 subunit
MAPLLLYDISIGGLETRVGIFGCTLSSSSPMQTLLSKSQKLSEGVQVTLQLVDAERIASPLHLLFATHHALSAFHEGTQQAKTIGMEILRYAAAQRQIGRALEVLGVSHSTTYLGGVLFNQPPEILRKIYAKLLIEIQAEDTPQVLEIACTTKAEAIKGSFNISDAEINAVLVSKDSTGEFNAITKLVYERCALLSIEK